METEDFLFRQFEIIAENFYIFEIFKFVDQKTIDKILLKALRNL